MWEKREDCEIICKLLVRKIHEQKSKNYFFQSIIGCDINFLQNLDINEDGLMDGVYICGIVRDTIANNVSEIVKLRNRPDIKKCIVFTNRSLRDIDSLKDIGEDEFNSLMDISILKSYVNEFEMKIHTDAQYSLFCDFLQNIILCISPEIEKLLEYLWKVEADYKLYENIASNEKLPLAANRNLFIFSMWASASKKFLAKGKIMKIFQASKPVNIHKRISSIAQISKLDSAVINERDKRNLRTGTFAKGNDCKKILFNMVCKQEYQQAYRQIYYEYVEQLLGGKNRIDNKREIAVSGIEIRYVDIYGLALQYLVEGGTECTIDKEDLEKQEIEEDKESEAETFTLHVIGENGQKHSYPIPYSTDLMRELEKEIEKKFSWGIVEKDERRKKYIQYWKEIEELCQNLNIVKDKREDIIRKVNNLGKAWMNFKNRGYTPIKFQQYLAESENTYEAFYDLAQYIMTLNEENRRKVASSGLLEKIVNIDIILSKGNLYISCYNPLLIFYLRQVNNRNLSCFNYCNQKGELFDYQLHFLEEYNQFVPNDMVRINGIKYTHILDNKKYRFPYYLRYKPMAAIASLKTINLLETIQYINDYIWENAYKSKIRVCLIGDIHLESAQIFVKKLEKMGKLEGIDKFVVQIVTKGIDSTRAILEAILDIRQGHEESIETKIENLSIEQYRDLKVGKYIAENDLVFLLDSSFMYHDAEYYIEHQSNIRNIVKYQSIEEEKKYLGVPTEENAFSMAVIPDMINCFQNASEELGLNPGKWDKYILNMRPILEIINEMRRRESEDKTVIFFSSDENLDRKIENDEYLKTIKEGKGGNKKLKIVVWKSTENRSKVSISKKGKGYLDVNMTGILNTFLSEETLDALWKNLRVRLVYEKYPNQISIQVSGIEEDDDIEEKKERIEQTINKYIISVLKNDFWLSKMIREIVLQNFWNSADSLEELVFIYVLKKDFSVEIIYEDSMDFQIKNHEYYIPPSQKKIWNNNVLQLFDIIEKEEFNPKMQEELDNLLRRDSCQITLEDCRYIAKTLESYKTKENDNYLVDNLLSYIRRV